jgi:hypothetical protein
MIRCGRSNLNEGLLRGRISGLVDKLAPGKPYMAYGDGCLNLELTTS